ncbi:MAG: lipoyl(octanoyl) transferase LipB [Alphaproteobacteria bacterium]|nr:lipoyl(octanoyl) transferase LipB [Alphaproteobacteria bacterium]
MTDPAETSASVPTPLDLPLEWRVSPGLTDYDAALEEMEARAKAIRGGTAGELIWLLEHPPVYTAGTSARREDLLNPRDALIRETGRGGEWTYHGPGQRVVYILLDVSRRGQDVRRFVGEVEGWAIAALAELGLEADRRPGYPGVWLAPASAGGLPDKITAIGVRLTKWVSWHGMAINFNPDLAAYDGIVPCGIHDGGVTRITAHKPAVTMADLDKALERSFAQSFPFDR